MPAFTGVDHMMLTVTDLENAMSDDEIRDYAAQLMGPEMVVGR